MSEAELNEIKLALTQAAKQEQKLMEDLRSNVIKFRESDPEKSNHNTRMLEIIESNAADIGSRILLTSWLAKWVSPSQEEI